MRKIKFRAWDTMARKMEPVGEITFDTGLEVAIGNHNGKTRSVNVQYQPHVILMQYTGLHDKTGKEIYENDIVRTMPMVPGDSDAFIGIVTFSTGTWFLFDGSVEVPAIEPVFSDTETREVIGNIYEDPDLLEVVRK